MDTDFPYSPGAKRGRSVVEGQPTEEGDGRKRAPTVGGEVT